MIDFDERWYYIRRARESREAAEEATNPAVQAVHTTFRRLYLAKADQTPPGKPTSRA